MKTMSAMRQSPAFVIGYLTALAYDGEVDGEPYQIRPEGLNEMDREVFARAVELLEPVRKIHLLTQEPHE